MPTETNRPREFFTELLALCRKYNVTDWRSEYEETGVLVELADPGKFHGTEYRFLLEGNNDRISYRKDRLPKDWQTIAPSAGGKDE